MIGHTHRVLSITRRNPHPEIDVKLVLMALGMALLLLSSADLVKAAEPCHGGYYHYNGEHYKYYHKGHYYNHRYHCRGNPKRWCYR